MPTPQAKRKPLHLRFAECRSMGHEWRKGKLIGSDDQTPDGFRRPFGMTTGMIGIPSHCSICGTNKVRWITRSGESVNRYEHPDGYSRHGDERLTVQEYRETYVASLFDQFTQAVDRGKKAS